MMRNALSLLALIALLSLSAGVQAELGCGDLFERIGHKLAAAEFQGCEVSQDKNGEPFSALYRVKGSDAAEVEAYLRTHFKMPSLKFSCCQWDAPNGGYVEEQSEYSYTIVMVSGETTVRERERWSQIPYFYIMVDGYSEWP